MFRSLLLLLRLQSMVVLVVVPMILLHHLLGNQPLVLESPVLILEVLQTLHLRKKLLLHLLDPLVLLRHRGLLLQPVEQQPHPRLLLKHSAPCIHSAPHSAPCNRSAPHTRRHAARHTPPFLPPWLGRMSGARTPPGSVRRSTPFWTCKVRCWRWLFANKIPISLRRMRDLCTSSPSPSPLPPSRTFTPARVHPVRHWSRCHPGRS